MKIKETLLLLSFTFLLHISNAQGIKKEITLEDLYLNGTFKSASINGLRSMSDGLHYTTLISGNNESFVIRYEYQSGKVLDTILKSSELIPQGKTGSIAIDDYSFSSDENKILISTETESIYRHSTKENYYIWDRKTKKLSSLSDAGKQMYADFSPDGTQIAFVRDNNLFLKNLSTNIEIQVTKDGLHNSIINGSTDWVYEEEFSFAKAFFWSPDGSNIAFYKFNESEVKEFSMSIYANNLYPNEYKFKYPKAGEANSKVSIHIYHVSTNTLTNVITDSEVEYIPRMKWTNDSGILSFLQLNRHQNKLDLMFANVQTGDAGIILSEESKTYIDINDNLTFLDNNKSFIWGSEKDGYNHLYLYDLNGKLINQITTGNWDVLDFKGIDKKNKLIYYISSEISPTDKDLYVIKSDGKNKRKLSTGKGTNDADFSEGYKYYINTYSDANTPPFISLHSSDGKQLRVLESNDKLNNIMDGYNISKKEFFTFKTEEGIELNGWMIKPMDFNGNKKYPVFMTVYGGPGINTVNNKWEGSGFLWHSMLAQKGYIVVSVDNRGTGARGEEFKKCTYKQLGNLETIDQIETAKYLGSMSFVDKNRIGIQGWSFGGYMTSLCMTKGAEYFKAGIAVAPVTNWKHYDNIYTERFLQTPQENPDGYDDNSPINFVKDMKGKFLLIHGTADDNVHFQNSAEMISALVNANKQFDLFIYPDKNHSINGGNTRMHLYTKMTNFILDNL